MPPPRALEDLLKGAARGGPDFEISIETKHLEMKL